VGVGHGLINLNREGTIFNSPFSDMWPQNNASCWPDIKALVKNTLPPVVAPEPIDPRIVKEHEDNLVAIAGAQAALEKAVERMDKVLVDRTAKTASSNKWNNRAGTIAEQERIRKDMEQCQVVKEKAQAVVNDLMRLDEPLVKKIEANKVSLEKHEKYLQVCEEYRVLAHSLYE
jgi:hypothetical protein